MKFGLLPRIVLKNWKRKQTTGLSSKNFWAKSWAYKTLSMLSLIQKNNEALQLQEQFSLKDEKDVSLDSAGQLQCLVLSPKVVALLEW